MNEYIRTDLAKELRQACEIENVHGISYSEKKISSITIERMSITTEEGAGIIGRPIGKYITVDTGKPWEMDGDEKDLAERVLSRCIKELSPDNIKTVLVCCLGNREITSDSLGPLCADSLMVTRHIKQASPELFFSVGNIELASICPGVLSQTGIETAELIESAVNCVKPDLIIAVDALCARSSARLACTFQFTDTGISPGSGIGNHRKKIDKNSFGVPVIAVGVPTVVNSSTLVYDALSEAGIENTSESLQTVLDNSKSFFVSPKESDIAVKESAQMLSSALNRTFFYRGNHILYR